HLAIASFEKSRSAGGVTKTEGRFAYMWVYPTHLANTEKG
ncbi:MAG: hypothetical protein ACI9W2_000444, partial [Gammaproteobacteria bacterium]